MAYEACLTAIQHAAGMGNLSADEAQAMLDNVLAAKDKIATERSLASDPALRAAAAELAAATQAAARASRMDALRNTAKRNAVMAQIEANGGLPNAIETIRSILHGGNRLTRDNIQTMWHGLSNGWQAALDNMLVKGGLQKAARSGQLDRQVAEAWWKINAGESAGAGPAAEIAKLYARAMDSVRDRLNSLGARIGDASDYVTRTSHDPLKMRRAAGTGKSPDEAFEAWWADTQPKLAEKTFAGIEPKDGETIAEAQTRFGRSVYDALLTGIHMKAAGEAEKGGYIPPAYEGTRNLARSLSQERTLFWKDGGAWHDYMAKYGQYPTLHASAMMALDRGARSTALMDKLGTNPAANLNQVLRRVQETYRGDADGISKFQNQVQGVLNVMGRLDGALNIPANMGLAGGAQVIRTWESMSSLGGVGVTHFASIWPTASSELVHHGVNRWEAIGNTIKALFQGQGDAGRRELLADLGAYADGIQRHTHSIIGDDNLPGRVSALASRFMDFTGIHYVFDRTKAGIRDMLAHNLGRNVGVGFDALDRNLSQMLGKYGIGASEWDLLRAASEMPVWNDRAYLTPSSAQRIDDGAAEALLRQRGAIKPDAEPDAVAKAVGGLKQSLQDKLLSYYTDASEHAVVTPGVRERAMLLGSTRPGTIEGEMLRFLTQFKMWPVAAMNQVLGREIYMSLSAKQAVWNLGMLVALGAPVGYMRMSINDLALGRPLRNPSDPRTMLAALAQSGGLGILGDFLFGETSRFGGGLVATLGGPVVSDADQVVQIFNKWKNGQAGWPDLAHFGVRHVPFANLVYLKGALDYMLWYHLYEAASPGWWERTNRRLYQEQGRPMVGYAPGQPIPWTPWGVGSSP